MFERYTEKARRVIFFARYEASTIGSAYVEPEHLLLGILRASPELMERASGADTHTVRREIQETLVTSGVSATASVDIPLSHAVKRALAYAAEEADGLNHRQIGSEHLLLGLLRAPKSTVPAFLRKHGVETEGLRRTIAGDSFDAEPPAIGDMRRGAVGWRIAKIANEDNAELSETRISFRGHEIVVIGHLSLSEDRKTLTYTQEIEGPGKSDRHVVDFDVS